MGPINVLLAFWIALPVFAFQTATTMPKSSRQTSTSTSNSALSSIPKLIVFDLDNTMWTPELYQLRKLQRANKTPRAGKDVKLMDGTKIVLEEYVPRLQDQGVQFAVASRTKSVEWAHS